jgi:WD40 repeat protein
VGLATASGAVYILHVKQRRYVLLDQHSREGTAVCIVSQPSRKLFVGFADGSIRCYDLATHSHIASLSGHGTSILSIAADGRGRLLVTASADKLLLWDAESFQQRRVLADLNFDRVMTAAADSGTLLAVAHASGHLTLLDAATKQLLVTSRTPCCKGQQHLVPSSIAFTPNRQQLLVACRAPPVLLVYDSPSLTLQQVLHVVGPGAGSLLQVQALPDSNSAAGEETHNRSFWAAALIAHALSSSSCASEACVSSVREAHSTPAVL